METSIAHPSGGYISRPTPSGLVDVINVILDKGLVIDIFIRVSLVGIELLTIDARIVIASVDTYLRFAEAVNRLNLGESGSKPGLPQLVEGVGKAARGGALGAAVRKVEKPVRAAKQKLGSATSHATRLPASRAVVSGAKRLPAATAAKQARLPSGGGGGRKGIFRRGKK